LTINSPVKGVYGLPERYLLPGLCFLIKKFEISTGAGNEKTKKNLRENNKAKEKYV
jgi:hypothetical protein